MARMKLINIIIPVMMTVLLAWVLGANGFASSLFPAPVLNSMAYLFLIVGIPKELVDRTVIIMKQLHDKIII